MICVKCKRDVPDGPYCCQCGAAQAARRSGFRRGNGQGNAYRRGKTWTGRASGYSYTDAEGNLHRRRPTKAGFATKKEALAWAASFVGTVSDKAPTLAQLWEGYSSSDMTKLSDGRQTAHRIARKRIEPIIGRRIDTLTLDDLQRVLNESCESYYPARDVKSLLSKLYQRAMIAQTPSVSVNLAQALVLPDLEESEAEPFTRSEVDAFWALEAAGDDFVGYILLLIYTGMMPAELMSCKVSMIDYEKHEIFGCGRKTSARKEIPIVFPDFLSPLVRDLASGSPKDKLLPINRDNFYKRYYATLEAAGVRKLPPYSCRHTYGTEVVKLGATAAVVQRMLRHSRLETQRRYTHLGADELHKVSDILPAPDKSA